jgi:hypothetical protein
MTTRDGFGHRASHIAFPGIRAFQAPYLSRPTTMKLIELRITKRPDGYAVTRVYEGVGNTAYAGHFLVYREALNWCKTVCPGVPVIRD